MGLKDAAFEQSSPICHMAELCEILKKADVPFAPILFYTQTGGPTTTLKPEVVLATADSLSPVKIQLTRILQ